MRKSSAPSQLSFDDVIRWGGARDGAGRKVVGRPRVGHVGREAHKYWWPMLVTLRAVEGLPSFRTPNLYAAFEKAVRLTRRPSLPTCVRQLADRSLV